MTRTENWLSGLVEQAGRVERYRGDRRAGDAQALREEVEDRLRSGSGYSHDDLCRWMAEAGRLRIYVRARR